MQRGDLMSLRPLILGRLFILVQKVIQSKQNILSQRLASLNLDISLFHELLRLLKTRPRTENISYVAKAHYFFSFIYFVQAQNDWASHLNLDSNWQYLSIFDLYQVININSAVKQTWILSPLRFRDSKTTFGKLRFFFHLCEKLQHDMGEFAEILAPSRKGFHIEPIKI